MEHEGSLLSTFHPIYANCDTPFMTYVNCQLLHVGLYTFLISSVWRGHLGAETCSSWHMS